MITIIYKKFLSIISTFVFQLSSENCQLTPSAGKSMNLTGRLVFKQEMMPIISTVLLSLICQVRQYGQGTNSIEKTFYRFHLKIFCSTRRRDPFIPLFSIVSHCRSNSSDATHKCFKLLNVILAIWYWSFFKQIDLNVTDISIDCSLRILNYLYKCQNLLQNFLPSETWIYLT